MEHNIIRTPVDALNVLGAGGLKAGTITQVYGSPGAGKSTFCYQTAGLYLKDNSDSAIHIIDVENSVDYLRLEHVFQIDMDRLVVHNFATLEQAFKLIIDISTRMDHQLIGKFKQGRKDVKIAFKKDLIKMEDKEFYNYCEQFSFYDGTPFLVSNYMKNREKLMKVLSTLGGYRTQVKTLVNPNYEEKGEEPLYEKSIGLIPNLVIWDTIAVSRPEAELDKIHEGNLAKNAAGMNLSTQVISTKLAACLSCMGGKPLSLFLPNQVRLKGFGNYGGPKESFYGSFALEHSCHYILKLTKRKTAESREKNYNDEIRMKTGSDIVMSIEKTKFCPATKDVNLYINDQLGGVFIPGNELVLIALDLNIIKGDKRGYEIKNHEELGKFKWDKESTGESNKENYLSNNPKIRKLLMEEVTRHYRKSYFTLDLLYQEVGLSHFGKPEEEDLLTQRTIEDQPILQDLQTNPFT